ncbi:GNAT family N-acetyltransferase [Flocculibacter collagenilyticus]|uniref:GNAT family N-acetyltransferase n=1 Tax=Flocculibacter collagenilyticus TaxID=2744479 RepID=UPI0018F78D0B|nr:GNAT family N-acetyltransferase [Flocculibacter collagenilyticus]
MQKIIGHTARLTIRHFTEQDTAFVIQQLNQPSFIEHIGDKSVTDTETALRYLRKGPLHSYRTLGFGLNLVELKDTSTAIGMCGILKRPELTVPDLGYAFLPEYWGKGYAKEAAIAVIEHAKVQHQLHHVDAITSTNNHASIKLLEALGFTFTAQISLSQDEELVNQYSWLAT